MRSCIECVGDCVVCIGSRYCWAATFNSFMDVVGFSGGVSSLVILDRAKRCCQLTRAQHWWMVQLLNLKFHLLWPPNYLFFFNIIIISNQSHLIKSHLIYISKRFLCKHTTTRITQSFGTSKACMVQISLYRLNDEVLHAASWRNLHAANV